MKLKLTLQRPHAGPVDIITTVDVATTVGALADHLVLTDPTSPGPPRRSHTLVRTDGSRTVLPPRTLVGESGLRSGSTVTVEPATDALLREQVQTEAAVVRVVSGPDEGRSFSLTAGTSIIGREAGCEVRLSDAMASRQHAKLQVGETVEIVDLGSANGLLVGDDVVNRAVLRSGDRVQIGQTTLVVNLGGGGGRAVEPGSIAFNRSPRIEAHWEGVEMVAPEPPEPPHQQRFPILPLFAPLVLGLVIYLATHALTSLIFVAMSPLLIVANAAEGRISGRKAYKAAVDLFRSDVADLVAEATALAAREVATRRLEHPSAPECRDGALGLTPLLWSRWPDLPGFGELRLGLGRQPSRSTIKVAGGRRNNRTLWKELTDAIAPFTVVDGVPIVARIEEGAAIGVGGPREASLALARSLVVQSAILHAPDAMSIAVFASSETAPAWNWMKWLPHCAGPSDPLEGPTLASTLGGCDALMADLERLAAERHEAGHRDGDPPKVPAVLVVVEDDAPIARHRALGLAAAAEKVGIHLIWVANAVAGLPAICRTFVDLTGGTSGGRGGYVRTREQVTPILVETVTANEAAAVARALAPVVDAGAGTDEQGDLPRTVSWLSLAGTDLATAPAAVVERWVESRSLSSGPMAPGHDARRPNTLRALVGQSVAGPHVLDLRTHGPHALVGGTTGSGKSELLQSWILGMASAHSPQRVTFLFVDYKGGSAFSDCLDLPHTVGLVTDLSPHLVRRALVSLAAELRYRETILHRKRAKDLLELERQGDPDAPPSLVIVVDEFAALVKEVPEFVDGVVNVAQRGRSLGLHLILATQRPAGVIKDNLRANTNLRMALRMADAEDSTDVLGSSEAASFDPDLPGRAVSRSGPAHLVPFQAAYAGGWTAAEAPPPEIHTEHFGFGPSQVWEVPQESLPAPVDPGPTDIRRVVDTIRRANTLADIPAPRRPWLAELAPAYDLARLPTDRRDDRLVFGVVDDPDHQLQPTVAFHPDEDGNLAIYGTGNAGKSAALRTLAVAAGLTVRGGPCHVYGLDFGAGGLRSLEPLPHVGSIISGSDHERLSRLIGMLRSTIEERAARFAAVDAGTIQDYRRLAGAPDEPRLLLLVDGFGAFRSAYEGTQQSTWFDQFVRIASDGRPVGVHVALTADRQGALPSSLASLIQRRLVLRLADGGDYAVLGQPTDVLDAKSSPGRGLLDGAEVQVAVLGGSRDALDQAAATRAFAAAMVNSGVRSAPPIASLGEEIELLSLPAEVGGLPVLGVSGETLLPMTFEPAGAFLVAGPPRSGRSTAVRSLLAAISRWHQGSRYFYFGQKRSSFAPLDIWEDVALDPTAATDLAGRLPEIVGEAGPGVALAVVVIENIAEHVNGPADFALQDMVKKLQAAGHLVIAEGETSTLNSSFPLMMLMRSGRNGIALQPDQTDGNIFRVEFPRVRKAGFPPGRGLLVARGAVPTLVQVAMGELRPDQRAAEIGENSPLVPSS